jgi:hypothetical protein
MQYASKLIFTSACIQVRWFLFVISCELVGQHQPSFWFKKHTGFGVEMNDGSASERTTHLIYVNDGVRADLKVEDWSK